MSAQTRSGRSAAEPTDPGVGGARGGRRRRHSGRRLAVEIVVFVVVVGGLLFGADRLARAGAESLVAQDVASATGTGQPVEVHVRGALFLPEVIAGSYGEVDVNTDQVTSGSLRIARIQSRLYDVRVPFHDVLVRDVRQIAIGRSEQRALLRWDDLNAYLDASGRPLTLAPGPNGAVRATGTIDVLGASLDIVADVGVSVGDGELKITPRQLVNGGTGLNTASRLLLTQQLTFPVPLQSLPFGHELDSIDATRGGVIVTATGRDILVQP